MYSDDGVLTQGKNGHFQSHRPVLKKEKRYETEPEMEEGIRCHRLSDSVQHLLQIQGQQDRHSKRCRKSIDLHRELKERQNLLRAYPDIPESKRRNRIFRMEQEGKSLLRAAQSAFCIKREAAAQACRSLSFHMYSFVSELFRALFRRHSRRYFL